MNAQPADIPPTRANQRRAMDIAWVVGIAIAAGLLSHVPYAVAARSAPADTIFLGQIALADDINSYYSFIRQAALGHVIFRNAMTYIDHAPVFVNIEWLALGAVMGLFDLAPKTVFYLWRAGGIIALLTGCYALARAARLTPTQTRVGLFMCAFGGGFGWLITALLRSGLMSAPSGPEILHPALDLYAGIQPFVQLTRNPHFSLPHGTFLLVFAALAMGERSGRARWYAVATAVAVLHGLIRPYDLISLFAILPAFIALEALIARRIAWRAVLLRAMPLIGAGPLLLYYVYIFSIHPVFKFWASQGDQPFVPLHWHVLSLGLAFWLFLWRIARVRTQPLSAAERLLAVWALVLLVLFHSYKVLDFMPYTPQLGVPLVTPMLILGVCALPAASRWKWPVVAGIVIVNTLSTPVYLVQETARQRPGVDPGFDQRYLHVLDLDAVDWLNRHAQESDVVLASYSVGTRISQFLNARVAVGHWALSPHERELSPRIDKVLEGRATLDEARALIAELDCEFVYAPMSGAPPDYFERLGFREVFANSRVRIFARADGVHGA